jgi:hypothetical protein
MEEKVESTRKSSVCFMAASKTRTTLPRRKNDEGNLSDPNQFKMEMAKIYAGWIGKMFGYKDGAASNIALILSLVLIVAAFFLSIYNIINIWSAVISLVSLSVGYLIGRKQG